LLIEEYLSREILEAIAEISGFGATSGTGITFVVDVDDVGGVSHPVQQLTKIVESE